MSETGSRTVERPLTADELDEMRRVHVGAAGPHTSSTCYDCWQGTCNVPRLLATIAALQPAEASDD